MAENEIVEKKESFSVSLTNKLNDVKEGLPRNFNIPRFVNNAVALMNGNDTLAKFFKQYPAGVEQAKQGLMRGAFLGLDAMNKEFYLIPYGQKLDFSVSYAGLKKLVMKYAITPIVDIYAEVIKQGDKIEYGTKDGQQYINHTPLPLNEGPTIGAFGVVLYPDKHITYTILTKGELDKIKASSKSGGAIWLKWYDEMAKKSALRRASKSISIDLENPQMRKAWEEDAEIITEETESAIDVEEDVVDVEENPVEIVEVE